jgi:hypothetical protein
MRQKRGHMVGFPKEKCQALIRFCCGAVLGLTASSVSFGAPIPPTAGLPSRVTDDTALYQRISEIQVGHEGIPNFDKDIERLSQSEGRYRERLPSLAANPRLKGPIARISAAKYRYAGPKQAIGKARPVRPTDQPRIVQ